MRFHHLAAPALATAALAQSSMMAPTETVSSLMGTATAAPNPEAPGLVEVASSSDQLSTLLSVLQEDRFSDLRQRLAGVYTCFAPTNDAFEAFLSTEDGQRFQDDDDYATWLLEYHFMLGVYTSAAFDGGGLVGSNWYRTWYYQPEASPGVDAQLGGYTDADGNVQIVSGYLETSMVEQADIEFSGGYVHVIDKVLTLPPSLPELVQTGDFTSLGGALGLAAEAGLDVAAFQELDRPTLFAPTNMAFENIGSLLGGLSAQDVANVLMYHIVDMPAFASDLEDGQELPTLGGGSVTVHIREGDDGPLVFINGARVVLPNLALIEGVAHGIDQVLNPNNAVSAGEDATAGAVQFDGAQSVDSPPLTSNQSTPTTTISMPGATGGYGSSNGTYGGGMPPQQTGAASALKTSGGLAVVVALAGLAF